MKKAAISMVSILVLLCAQKSESSYKVPKSLPKSESQKLEISHELRSELRSEPNSQIGYELESALKNYDSEREFEYELNLQMKYRLVNVEYTAYYGPKKGQRKYVKNYAWDVKMNGSGKKTAYGTKPRFGIVATDPEVFPRGTKMLIVDPLDGVEKIFVAGDTGGAIIGKHIDIFTGFGDMGLIRAQKMMKTGNRMIVKVLSSSSMLQS